MPIAQAQFTIVDFNDINISTTAPTSPVVDQLWLDSSIVPNQLKRWTGSSWAIVNDVQIGGKNLLLKTGMRGGEYDLSGNVGTGVTTTVTVIDEATAPHGKAITISRTDSTTTSGGRYWRCQKLITGQTYTWSVWLKGSGSWTVGQEQGGSKVITLADTWTKYTHTFTANSSSYYQFVFYTTTLNGNVSIHSLKLEEGNKATSWTPAPKDVQGQIDTHETRISTAESTITQHSNSIALKVNTSDFTTYKNTNDSTVSSISSRLSTAESSISVLQGQITTKVTQTDVNNSIDNINIGGTNLVKNGSFDLGADGLQNWSNASSGLNISVNTNSALYNRHYVYIQNLTTTEKFLYQLGIVLKPSTTYTASFYYHNDMTGNSATGDFYVLGQKSATTGIAFDYTHGVTGLTNTSGSWIKKTLTFTTASDEVKAIIRLDNNGSTTGAIRFGLIKLEEGNKATFWSPAPEDIQGQIDTHETRISTAETKITPSAIVSTVRSSAEYTNDQGLKVNKATVISEINQSAEAIKIQAGKIDINGAVTFSSLDTAMKNAISQQGQITKNPIFADWTSTFPTGFQNWSSTYVSISTTLASATTSGATTITVASASNIWVGTSLTIGSENKTVTAVSGTTVTLNSALTNAYASGVAVTGLSDFFDKETTLTRNGGYGARFNVTTLGQQVGMQMNSSAYVSNVSNSKYLFLEVDFMLVSGSLDGACVLVDWSGMSPYRVQVNLYTEVPSPTLNKWYTIRKVIQRPTDTLTGWTGMGGHVLANWSGSGNAVKDIIFDRVAIREASQQEIDLFNSKSGWDSTKSTVDSKASGWDSTKSTVDSNSSNWTDAKTKVDLWKHTTDSTKIDGAEIYTGSISADKITVANWNNFCELSRSNLYGKFTASYDATYTNKTWYTLTTLSRDTVISKTYTCNGGEAFRIKFDLTTDVQGASTSGGASDGYKNVNVGIYGKKKDGTNFYCIPTGGKNCTGLSVNTTTTLPSDAVQFYVCLQIAGYSPFSGTVSVSNILVQQMSAGELIVDGAISANKIASRTITADRIQAGSITVNELASSVGSSLNISSNNSITNIVNNYATTSYVNQTADSITYSFKGVSGQNLLLNSTGLGGTNNWISNSTLVSVTDSSCANYARNSGGVCLRLANNVNNSERMAWSQQFNVKSNTKYTISGWYYVGSGSQGIDIYILCKKAIYDNNGYYIGYDYGQCLLTDSNAGTGVWKFFSYTYTTPSDAKSAHIRFDNNGSIDGGEHYVYVAELMVNEGDTPKNWCPNSNEIYGGTTVIDRTGLTVKDGQFNVVSQGRNIFKVQDGYHYNEWGMACRLANGSSNVYIGSGSTYFNSNESCLYRPFGIYHESLSNPQKPLMLLTNTNRCEIRDLNASTYKGIGCGTGEFDSFIYSNSYISGANIINRSLREIKTDITRYDDTVAYEGIKGVNIYNFNMGCNDAEGNAITSLNLGIMVDEAPIEIVQLGGGEGADRKGINLYSYTSYLASALKTAIGKIEELETKIQTIEQEMLGGK